MSEVVGRAAPLGGQPVASHLVSLVALVVKGGEGQDVEEEERCTHGDCHAKLSGIVPHVSREEVLVWTLGTLGLQFRGECSVGLTGGGARARYPGPGSVIAARACR